MKTEMKPLQQLNIEAQNWVGLALNGQWESLLLVEGTELAEALRCRALLMTGHLNQAEQIMTERKKSPDLRAQILWHLCRSHLHFVRGEPRRALHPANKAFLLAKNNFVQDLIPDASFYRALCLTELDEKYQALALYQNLRRQKNLTEYRRNLALSNEAWLLWDLGLIEPLSEIAEDLPLPFGHRVRLMLKGLQGELPLEDVDGFLHLPLREKENLFLLFLEEYLVLGSADEVQAFQNKLFFKDVIHNSQSALIHFVRGLLQGAENLPTLAGRDEVDGLFLRALISAQENPAQAQSIYFQELMPLMKAQKYYSPFMPTEAQCRSPRNAWEKMLADKLGLGISNTKKAVEILPDQKALRFHHVTISFQQSPTTWTLLVAFQGQQKFKKEQIHELLTSNRYRSDLHDTRIFKLVQRINAKSKKYFGFELCRFNGAGELETCCEFKRGVE